MDFFNKLYLILALVVLTAGCGKEAKQESSVIRQDEEVIASEAEAQIARQSVSCDNGISCPDSIAKIVIVDRARLKTCTGFLVNGITVATAASCLSEKLQNSDNERVCQTDVHIFFAQSDFRAAKRVRCARILLKTPIVDKDPVLWRNDMAYIELAEPVYRRALSMTRDGVEDKDAITMWKVDQENDQVGIIRKTECKTALHSYVNPLSSERYSPGFLISNCTLKTGNKGAPILNEKGRWLGLFSGNVNSAMMSSMNTSGYLVEPLMSIGHVSSAVCLPALRDADQVTRRECFRDMDNDQLNRARGDLLSNPPSHQEKVAEFAKKVSGLRAYLNWTADMVKDGERLGSYKLKFMPKCLKPVDDWIRTFSNPPGKLTYQMSVPDWRLSIGLDRAGRIVTKVDDDNKKIINVEFSPSQARSSRSSYVKVWSGSVSDTYNGVNESCQ